MELYNVIMDKGKSFHCEMFLCTTDDNDNDDDNLV